MLVCVCVLVSNISDAVRSFVGYILAPALQCLGVISGGGGSISVVCVLSGSLLPQWWVPAAFSVPWWHRVRCDACVVSWLDACTAAWFVVAVRGLCSFVGLRLWASVFNACVPSVVSCSSF